MEKLRVAKLASMVFLVCMASAIASRAQSFTSLVSFDEANGDNPYSALVQGANGNFYGTTASEYGTGYGTVFEMTPAGDVTTLYNFCSLTNCIDGAYPVSGLTQARNGNFYGTTNAGGINDYGTVFEITPAGRLTTLYSFCSQTNCADGIYPVAGLVQATNGNFFGTTAYDGANGGGTIFEITAAGKLTTLYSFCSQTNCADGEIPFGTLIQAKNGSFYGTTYSGGANRNYGTVFELSWAGGVTTLYSFCSQTNCADGDSPYGGLVQAANGYFYGATANGGTSTGSCDGYGCGTVFEISAAGKLTTLYNFCSKANCVDGEIPTTGLLQARDGNLYGTTAYGGTNCLSHGSYSGCGTVFEITPTGKFTSLHSFDSTDGSNPQAPVFQATDGTFYGTTLEGGSGSACTGGCGTVFSFSK